MSCYKELIFIFAVCLSHVLLLETKDIFPETRTPKYPDYYRAAVFEHMPYKNSSLPIREAVRRNLATYNLAASVAHSNEVDILVLPETTLFTDLDAYQLNRAPLVNTIAENIPNPKEGDYNPCDQETVFQKQWILRNLSCLAKSKGMYIVANVVDFKNCSKRDNVKTDKNATINCSDKKECPADGFYLFNTNVIFDRVGKLIARYHKKHLYFEPTMNGSKCPDDGFFNTDFGNFTTIVCFDIVFKESKQNIERLNVDNLAYPYYWFDHTPVFSFATIYQQGIAMHHKINILAANGQVPGTGTVGSGIFAGGHGALISTHQSDGRSKLLISNVPRHPKVQSINMNRLNRKRFVLENGTYFEVKLDDVRIHDDICEMKDIGDSNDFVKDYRCNSNYLTGYKYEKLINKQDTVRVCNKQACCTVSYKARSMNEDYFVAISTTDFQLYEIHDSSANICFLTRCKPSSDGKNCSSFVLKSKTIFEKVDLKGTLPNKYIYPYAVDSSLRLTKKGQWSFHRNHIVYQHYGTNSSLLFLGMFGRDYIDKTF